MSEFVSNHHSFDDCKGMLILYLKKPLYQEISSQKCFDRSQLHKYLEFYLSFNFIWKVIFEAPIDSLLYLSLPVKISISITLFILLSSPFFSLFKKVFKRSLFLSTNVFTRESKLLQKN